MALTFAFIASILCYLGMSPRLAAITSILGGLTGLSPFYAKTYFSEPLAGLFLVLALWAIFQAERREKLSWLFTAGLCLGASMLTRVAHGALLIPALIALIWWLRAHNKHVGQGLGLAALGFAIPLLLLGAYNFMRFGHFLETGYGAEINAFNGDPVEGLLGLLMSPGRGLFWYVPWSLVALFSVKTFWNKHQAATLYIVGSLVTLLAIYAPWHMWEGGWCYGPRFLVPIAPLLLIPAALGIYSHWHRVRVRYAVICIGALSVALAVTSAHVNYLDFHFAGYQLTENWSDAVRWSLDWAPLNAYWSWPERTFLLLPHLLAGEGGNVLRFIAGGILVGCTLSLVSLAKWLRKTKPTLS
jgi:4-amino-4-deoxy-L-arabinose transferase-like glycosyltransferase